jgi:aspartyl-tRNA(Asn)/glutamyl-tRNA(Gln) amidotransferase subunit B
MGQTFSIRDKEDDPDYRFFLDPDLPAIHISQERKQSIVVDELPFEAKHRFCSEYGLEVAQVKIVFKYPWLLPLFTKLCQANDPKLVF